MRQSAGSNAAAGGLDRSARSLRHQVAGEVLAGAFRSSGQKCTATSRPVVEEPVADEFPFCSAKQSAYGPKEQGRAARGSFTRTKTVRVRPSERREQ